jgi:PHD/YefM family antitoxin component YafN of YafNO toxin-antitoxin module
MDNLAKTALLDPTMAATPPVSTSSTSELLAALPVVSASELKNSFGEVTTRALKGPVAIKRHRRAEFVLMPVADYVALQEARVAPLADLSAKFDAMVARMNTPAAKRGVRSLFDATPASLGKSAVKAAHADGR